MGSKKWALDLPAAEEGISRSIRYDSTRDSPGESPWDGPEKTARTRVEGKKETRRTKNFRVEVIQGHGGGYLIVTGYESNTGRRQ